VSKLKIIFLLLTFALLSACSEGPGPLEGTWKMSGLMPLTVTFRDGEEESMGLISKVTYKQEGNDVLVTYVDGLAKGTTMRVTITSSNTAVTGMGKLTRIK
jgi:hypothetical protein